MLQEHLYFKLMKSSVQSGATTECKQEVMMMMMMMKVLSLEQKASV